MKNIAYQGVQGAFSYQAPVNQFGSKNHFLGLSTFKDVFDLVRKGEADFGVIPIENSLIGSIYENYDLLNKYELKISGECFTRIEHCVLTLQRTGLRIEEIQKVFSHPKALEQCSQFFQTHPWIKPIVHMDTAAAAAEVASLQDPSCAAIAGECAGKIYNLQTLLKGIEDEQRNYTRFFIITAKDVMEKEAGKCSLILCLNHTPGTLSEAVRFFANHKTNLTKIESRPIWGSPFEYLFYIDLEFQ